MKSFISILVIIIFLFNLLCAQSQFGMAMDTDGNGDYMQVADKSVYYFADNDFTVEYWVYKQETTTNWDHTYGISKWNSGAYPGTNEWTLNLSTDADNDTACFVIECGSNRYRAISQVELTLNTWTHLAGVRDSAFIKLYVNGVIADSERVNNLSINDAGREVRIAFHDYQYPYYYYTNAMFDEARIWNYARSAEEIQSTMNDTLSPEFYLDPDNGLIGYWRFDEYEDLGIQADGADDIRDLASQQNHGDTYGYPVLVSWVTSGIELKNIDKQVKDFHLNQNYPNPFNPTTTISYTVGAQNIVPQHVELSIYNTLGQKVATLVNKKQPPGMHRITFNGLGLAGGIYFYKIEIDTENGFIFNDIKKCILIK